MNEIVRAKTPWHLWVIGVLGLLWNLGGVSSYMMTELGQLENLEMPAAQMEYFYGFPAWATAFWALGVWGAALGSVLLLLRRKLAVAAYAVSVIGLVGVTYYERFVADIPASLATPGQLVFAAFIWATTLFLLFYSRAMTARGVLR